MRDIDWDNFYYSEVFRNYVIDEMRKEAEVRSENDHKISTSEALDKIEKMEKEIRSNAQLLNKFKVIQAKLIEDPEFYDRTDKKFAEVVLMMNFDNDEE